MVRRPSLARRSTACATSSPGCRWRAWSSSPTALTPSDASLNEALLALKAEKLPVFTVGVGSEQLPRDIQIDRVSTPRTVLKDASLLLDVVVRQTGYDGRTVTVDVEDEGRIVGSEKVQLPTDGSPGAGPRAGDGGRIRSAALQVQGRAAGRRARHAEQRARGADQRARCQANEILYFEGEPRFEMKFLRRAVADDKNLRGRRAAADR